MKEFHSLGAFSEHILKTALAEEVAIRTTLGKCAKVVETEAKSEIGTYQEQAGPFIAWQELSENTLYGGFANGIRYPGKIELGYATDSEHNPLLRTGDLRDSIGVVMATNGMEAQIGSDSDIAVYQELGTKNMPPRSFLGGAMVRKTPAICEALGATVLTALVGKGVVGGGAFIEGNELLALEADV